MDLSRSDIKFNRDGLKTEINEMEAETIRFIFYEYLTSDKVSALPISLMNVIRQHQALQMSGRGVQ